MRIGALINRVGGVNAASREGEVGPLSTSFFPLSPCQLVEQAVPVSIEDQGLKHTWKESLKAL